MRFTPILLATASLPTVLTFGGFGHITIAYLASSLISPPTTAYFQTLLHNTTTSYLAGVATWADSIRYTKWGRFSANFHFIDAHDSPPHSCNLNLTRDCKADGCVVSAIANYTSRLLDTSLPPNERAIAAKFVVHFIGDTHQPLHNEDVARGGNGIKVLWDGKEFNLHHVWDSSIAERIVGGVRRQPYEEARKWAEGLKGEIETGKWNASKGEWLDGASLEDVEGTALRWAGEGNGFVCSHVLPEGPEAIVGQELGGEYYDKAAPVIELQVAKAGYRLAAWLDLIVARIMSQQAEMGDL